MEGFDDLFDDQFLDSVWQPMMNGGTSTLSSFASSASSAVNPNSTHRAGGTNNNHNMVFDMDDLMNGDFLDNTMLGNTSTISTTHNPDKNTLGTNAGGPYTSLTNTVPSLVSGGTPTENRETPSTHMSQQFQQSVSPGSLYFGGSTQTMNSSLNHGNPQEISPFSAQFLSSPAVSVSTKDPRSSTSFLSSSSASASSSSNPNRSNGNPETINQYSISRSNVFALNVLPTTNYAQHQVGAAVVNNQTQPNPHHSSSSLSINTSYTQASLGTTGNMTDSTKLGTEMMHSNDNSNSNNNDFDDNDYDDDDLDNDDEDYNDPVNGGNKSGTEGGPNGTGKYSSSTNAKLLSADERRLKRLERNRESARQSRQRKKQYLALLEGRVVALQQQIYELRSSHASAAYQMLEEQRQRLLFSLEQLAYKEESFTPEEEASIQDAAVQLVDRFGPDCAERRAVREFHFDQLHRLLLPPHTKFLLWLIHQPNDFFVVNNNANVGTNNTPHENGTGTKGNKGTEKSNKKGMNNDYDSTMNSPHTPSNADAGGTASNRPSITLWTLLCAEIGLANDQAERFRAQLRRVLGGPDLPRETWRLGVAAAYLQRLRVGIAASAAKAQNHLEKVAEILTPAQLIRYLAWMERNKERVSKAIEQTVVSPVTVGNGVGTSNGGNNGRVASVPTMMDNASS